MGILNMNNLDMNKKISIILILIIFLIVWYNFFGMEEFVSNTSGQSFIYDTGNATLGNLIITDGVKLPGNITVSNGNINGNLSGTVTGNVNSTAGTSIFQDLRVNGELNGNPNTNNTVSVNSNLTLTNNNSLTLASGNLNLTSGNLNLTSGTINGNPSGNPSNTVTIGGNLVARNLTITDGLINGDIRQNGANTITMGGNLTVNGQINGNTNGVNTVRIGGCLTVANILTVTGGITGNLTGNLNGNVVSNGRSIFNRVSENFQSAVISGSTYTLDYSTGSVFYSTTSPTGTFTVQINNLPNVVSTESAIITFIYRTSTLTALPNKISVFADAGSTSIVSNFNPRWTNGVAPTITLPTGVSTVLVVVRFLVFRSVVAGDTICCADLVYY